jgi:hypothetical protein
MASITPKRLPRCRRRSDDDRDWHLQRDAEDHAAHTLDVRRPRDHLDLDVADGDLLTRKLIVHVLALHPATAARMTAGDARNANDAATTESGRTRSATVQVNKNDTLEDLASKISLALWDPANGGNGVVNSAILDPLDCPGQRRYPDRRPELHLRKRRDTSC